MAKQKVKALVLSCVFALGIVLPFASCGGTGETGDSRSSEFDESSIALSFSAMSDIHQQVGKTTYSDYLINALDYAKELNGAPLDLALFAGDLTEEAWRTIDGENYIAEYDESGNAIGPKYNADIEQLKTTLLTALDLDETPVFYCLGNHDTDPSRLGAEYMSGMPQLFYDMLGEEFFKADAEDSVPEAGLRHAVVKGYHFLSVNPDRYWTLRGYSDETLAWVDNQLKAITSENPDRYVFVTAHPPIYGTVFRSYTNDWADLALGEVLEKYPQVIYLSGHIHNVLQDEIQISQNGSFTSLDCGSVKYTGVMNDLNDAGSEFDNSVGTRIDDFSQGLLIQVDVNGNVRVTRCDYYQRKPIKDAWILSYPKTDNSHLLAYDNDLRQQNNTAPVFAEDAWFTVSYAGDTLTFDWTAAQDDDQVRYYRIVIYQTNGDSRTKLQTFNLATFTYRYDRVEDMPDRLSYSRVVTWDGNLTFELSAIDVWNARSKDLTYSLTI